ncbi:MAG: 50S ribosomal protein L15 [Patescibacteria group bacterium]
MQLHQLQPTIKSKNKKRVGRGGKRGTYSGRGTKGQKSRAGRRIKPGYLETIKRLPKLRGFRNKPLKERPAIINIADLEKKIKNNIINREELIRAGLIRKSDKRVKILSPGEIKRPLQIEGIAVSESARKKIEEKGGKIK